MKCAISICLAVLPNVALAFTPELPSGALQLAAYTSEGSHYELPIDVFDGAQLPTARIKGTVYRDTWRIEEGFVSTTDLVTSLEQQLAQAGYDIVLTCESDACGGFDFRFKTEILPPPEMFVDLSDYRFISARRAGVNGPEAVGVMVSQTAIAGMVQVIQVAPRAPSQEVLAKPPEEGDVRPNLRPDTDIEVTDLISRLSESGHVVLADLSFETGSSRLAKGPFETLKTLSEFLVSNPDIRVVLVGHTDNSGDLDKNIELSKKRAESVQTRLSDTYGVPIAQIQARGVGYLAPLGSNADPAGRDANRRVEVVLLAAP